MSKLQGYIDDLTNKRKILTKGEFVELSPGATKEILEILVKHKEAIEQLEQAQATNKKLIEGLEWYSTASESDFYRDSGYRAILALSEVKGNG